jgi:hypothetical protein
METIGRSRVSAYTARARSRVTGSAGRARSGCSDQAAEDGAVTTDLHDETV